MKKGDEKKGKKKQFSITAIRVLPEKDLEQAKGGAGKADLVNG